MNPKTNLLRLILEVICISLFFVITGCQPITYPLHGSPYTNPKSAPNFTLTQSNGDSFTLSDQVGAPVILFFGYTFCPDICPATLAHMRWIFEELGDDSAKVNFAFITIDPERDTPETLETHLKIFNPEFIGLWGDPETLESIKAGYGVFAEKDPASEGDQYLMTHTARLFLIDQDGLLRTNYAFGTPREEILADLRQLLRGYE